MHTYCEDTERSLLSAGKEDNPDQKLTPLDLNLGLLTSRTVRKLIVKATQPMVFCYGNPSKLRQKRSQLCSLRTDDQRGRKSTKTEWCHGGQGRNFTKGIVNKYASKWT